MLKCQYCEKTILNKRNAIIGNNDIFCTYDCFTWYDYRLEKLEDLIRNCQVTKNRLKSKIKDWPIEMTKGSKTMEKNLRKYIQNEKELLHYTSRMETLKRSRNNDNELSFIFVNKRTTD